MNWIDKILYRFVQFYLAIIYYSIITISSLCRTLTNKKSIIINRKDDRLSYWIDRNENNLYKNISQNMFFVLMQRGDLIIKNAISYLKNAKIDYFLILILLLPVRYLLKIDKSERIDPSIYVMY